MPGRDYSEWQDPNDPRIYVTDFGIVRTSHGLTADKHYIQHTENLLKAGKPYGFYHTLESSNVAAEARFFSSLVLNHAHSFGTWLDAARGDIPPSLISTFTFDTFRSIIDSGIYCQPAAIPIEYQRFERIWAAFPTNLGTLQPGPPGRWLLWQVGQAFGSDIDVAADLAPKDQIVVKDGWEAFTWPNL